MALSPVQKIIADTIHTVVGDITDYDEETAQAVINALAYEGYHIVGTGAKTPRPQRP